MYVCIAKTFQTSPYIRPEFLSTNNTRIRTGHIHKYMIEMTYMFDYACARYKCLRFSNIDRDRREKPVTLRICLRDRQLLSYRDEIYMESRNQSRNS